MKMYMQNGHKASNLCNYVGVPCDRGKLRLSSYFRVFYFRSLTPLHLDALQKDKLKKFLKAFRSLFSLNNLLEIKTDNFQIITSEKLKLAYLSLDLVELNFVPPVLFACPQPDSFHVWVFSERRTLYFDSEKTI